MIDMLLDWIAQAAVIVLADKQNDIAPTAKCGRKKVLMMMHDEGVLKFDSYGNLVAGQEVLEEIIRTNKAKCLAVIFNCDADETPKDGKGITYDFG